MSKYLRVLPYFIADKATEQVIRCWLERRYHSSTHSTRQNPRATYWMKASNGVGFQSGKYLTAVSLASSGVPVTIRPSAMRVAM